MRPEVFVDAGAWIAVAHARDQHHARAVDVYPRLLRESLRLVTTNLVIGEAHAVLMRKVGIGPALEFLDRVFSSGRIELVHPDRTLTAEALALLRQYRGQGFSLADAVSFALMRLRGIETAFAFDRNFAAAGFRLTP